MTTSPSDRRARHRRGAEQKEAVARSVKRREGRPPPLPTAPRLDSAGGARASRALAIGLGALVAARAGLTFAPGMWAWGFNAARFLPIAGWTMAALAALALAPPLARRLEPRLAALGDSLARRAFPEAVVLVALTAALVALLPDRVWLVGDFLLRLGCARGQIPVDLVFPQALPLDVFLHHHFPVILQSMDVADTNTWERVLGAAEAGALAALAIVFGRELGLSGAALVAAFASVCATGLLGMFTGYGKGFVELTVLTVGAGVAALRFARTGRGAWWMAIAIIAALAVHRSAITLLLLPPVAGVLWWRAHGARAAAASLPRLAALAAPFLAAGLFSSQLIASMKVTDAAHLAPTGRSPGAIAGAAFAPMHLLEILNLIGQETPLLLLAPIVALAPGSALAARRREWVVLLALVVPALLILLFVHPRQGLFRDYDVFAPSLVSLALASALLFGDTLRATPARAWLVPALALVTAGAALEHLLLQNQITAGFHRIEAYLEGPPRRSDTERALLWSFVAERQLALDRRDQAVASFAKAADFAPSPRILLEWALAEEDRHDWAAAREVYRKLVARSPEATVGWLGIANNSVNLADRAEAWRAAMIARQLEPSRPEAIGILNMLARGDSLHVVP
ncbi:MAG TPA: hypothetical protein VMJ70_00880 [Candidatus Sulfotelmatobacter sp.]|nr:hypothetical protein [Candidatus Sulfotelmatobacter sp.]